jgi:hypothetical protein
MNGRNVFIDDITIIKVGEKSERVEIQINIKEQFGECMFDKRGEKRDLQGEDKELGRETRIDDQLDAFSIST